MAWRLDLLLPDHFPAIERAVPPKSVQGVAKGVGNLRVGKATLPKG